MTVLDDTAGDLKRENAELQRRLAERDSDVAELQRRLAEREAELAEAQGRLAERDSEFAEAIAQQAASSEVLQVINSSSGDLAPVFDAILEKALRLCEADFGTLFIRDGDQFRGVATRNLPPALAVFVQAPFEPSATGFFKRAAKGQDVAHIPDLSIATAHISGDPRGRALVELGGARTLLAAALRNNDTVLGAFSIYRTEVRPFADEQIALLKNFAAQAVIAMENARLITETREALAQQTATAEVLGVINSSPGNLTPVFDAILDKGLYLCEAAFGTLWTFDGECFHAVALHRVPAGFAEVLTRAPYRPEPGSGHESLLRGASYFQLHDAGAELSVGPVRRALVELGGARTVIAVPLRKEGTILGAISAYRQEVRSFTDKQIALLQNFAAQAVIAMENARLITETREALEQQTATAEVLGVINASPGDLAPVFDAMLDKALRLCEAQIGNITTCDGEQFQFAATAGHREFAEWVREHGPFQPEPGTTMDRMLRGEDIIHIADIADDVPYRAGSSRWAAVEIGGFRTSVQVALRKDGRLLGQIAIYRQEVRPFTDKQIALLQNFAAQAVIAMENARLLGELRQRTDEVAELNRGLEARVAEQVEELGRVGRLKRFLAPQLAELIVSQGDEKILESHRREIVVVFCDLRGYTAFTETAEPEEVLDFLREYHGALGPLVSQFEGTLDQFSGDGIMVFFNDPVPVPDPAERAVKMSIAMRETANRLIGTWRQRDRELGFGAGIAQGYATLGQIGFADRSGYTAIGTVCNLAARLCGEAKDGQILVAGRVAAAVRETTALEDIGPLVLKGLTQPVSVFNVKGLIVG